MTETEKKNDERTTGQKLHAFIKHFIESFNISWQASWNLFLMRIVLELVTVVTPIISVSISGQIINILSSGKLTQDNKINQFIIMICFLVSLQLFNMITDKLRTLFGSNHQDLIANYIEVKILRKVSSLDVSYFDNPTFYNEIKNANRDSQSMQSLTWLIITMIRGFVQAISCAIILGKINIIIPVTVFMLSLPGGLVDKYIAKKKYEWQRSRTLNERKISYIKSILENRQYSKDVRVFNIGDYLFGKFLVLWKQWFKEKRKIELTRVLLSFSCSILPYSATIFMLVYVGLQIINGRLLLGDFTKYNGITSQFLAGVASMLTAFNQGYESEMRLTNYTKFLNWESRIDKSGRKELDRIKTVEFKGVCFTYPETDKKVLKNISFKIDENKKVAIVGTNGAGKSTIVKLLMHLYEPDSGTILINGIDIKEYDISSLHKSIGVVFQDYNKYSFMLKDTISITDTSNCSNEEHIKKACKEADLEINNEKFTDGVNTYLGKSFDVNGVELSGGQWQKIAIAQAYFKDSSFMIMDEPNASLDPEAEYKVFQNLKRLCENKGALFITHRLSNISMADEIIVIESGNCIEQGTHEQLVNKNGRYAELFAYQADRYTKLSDNPSSVSAV